MGPSWHEQLRNLFVSIFSHRDLRIFLDDFGSRHDLDITSMLGLEIAPVYLAHDAMQVLGRQGLVNYQFFDLLSERVPGRSDAIEAVREAWLAQKTRPPNPGQEALQISVQRTSGSLQIHVKSPPFGFDEHATVQPGARQEVPVGDGLSVAVFHVGSTVRLEIVSDAAAYEGVSVGVQSPVDTTNGATEALEDPTHLGNGGVLLFETVLEVD